MVTDETRAGVLVERRAAITAARDEVRAIRGTLDEIARRVAWATPEGRELMREALHGLAAALEVSVEANLRRALPGGPYRTADGTVGTLEQLHPSQSMQLWKAAGSPLWRWGSAHPGHRWYRPIDAWEQLEPVEVTP